MLTIHETEIFSRYPRSTISSQPRRLDVSAVVQLHVIVPTVGLLLDLKHLEDDLHSVTLLSRDHPQTVGAARVVVIPKLSMRVQIFGLDLGFQASSTFWEFTATKLEGQKEALVKVMKECSSLNAAENNPILEMTHFWYSILSLKCHLTRFPGFCLLQKVMVALLTCSV